MKITYKDALGMPLKEGDIIVRAKFSSFTFHKVLKINTRGIVLSCERDSTTFTRHWHNGVRYPEGTEVVYRYIKDSRTLEDVNKHNSKVNIGYPWVQWPDSNTKQFLSFIKIA